MKKLYLFIYLFALAIPSLLLLNSCGNSENADTTADTDAPAYHVTKDDNTDTGDEVVTDEVTTGGEESTTNNVATEPSEDTETVQITTPEPKSNTITETTDT